jgi:hypothetical protein
MQKQYANITQNRGQILMRGYEDGKRVSRKIHYKPYLFLDSPDPNAKYRTIKRQPVERIDFDSIGAAREFTKKYEGVDGFNVYGMTNWQYLYLYDNYGRKSPYERDLIRIMFLDIENKMVDEYGNKGFPDIKAADREITAVTLHQNNHAYVYGYVDYTPELDNVTYTKCKDEKELLNKVIDKIRQLDPDIVSGWNCIPANSLVSTENGLVTINELSSNQQLLESKTLQKVNTGVKREVITTLTNGLTFKSSEQHRMPVLTKDINKYKNTNTLLKTLTDKRVCEIDMSKYNYFIIPKQNFTGNVTNNTCADSIAFVQGLAYTDGTLWSNNKTVTIYNNNLDLLQQCESICIANNIKCRWASVPQTYPNTNCNPTYRLYIDNLPLENIYVGRSKVVNLNYWSKCSIDHFYNFLGGVIAGDGTVSKEGKISFCDWSTNSDHWQALLLHRGILPGYHKGSKVYTIEVARTDIFEFVKHKAKVDRNFNYYSHVKINAISKHIRYFEYTDFWAVRIKSIDITDNYVEMCDIETDTHYFIANGVKSHNSQFYDIPYITNRCVRILGTERTKDLSPWKIIERKEITAKFGKTQELVTWVGISSLDYLDVYKKFRSAIKESYKLDYIASEELSTTKLDYSEYGDLDNLYSGEFDVPDTEDTSNSLVRQKGQLRTMLATRLNKALSDNK